MGSLGSDSARVYVGHQIDSADSATTGLFRRDIMRLSRQGVQTLAALADVIVRDRFAIALSVLSCASLFVVVATLAALLRSIR